MKKFAEISAAFVFAGAVFLRAQTGGTPAPQPSEQGSPSALVGIGALLKSSHDYVEITQVIPGGSAQTDGRIKVGDRFTAVAAASGKYVDVKGMPLDKVVKMIRGEKGAHVRLLVLPADAGESSQPKEIDLVRDEVDFSKAADLYQKAAAQGDATAQVELGSLYWEGKGVTQDYNKAAELYEKAAVQGDAKAQVSLGWCYAEGKGVSQNDEKAVEWYQKAAVQGNAQAQFNLGWCYAEGKGVSQNDEKAVEWWEKAAVQGGAKAQVNLGKCYQQGRGVSQNDEKAVEWFQKAAVQGDAKAQFSLGWCYDLGKGVSQNQKKAVEWYQKAAVQGNAKAQVNLGVCYVQGKGVSQNYQKAAEWYQKAAGQGDSDAQAFLGFLYENGHGVEKNARKAAELYRKSAEQNNFRGQFNLSDLYKTGVGVLQDYVEALKWLDLAAISGEAPIIEARDALARRMTAQGVGKAQQLARQFLEEHNKATQAKVPRTRTPDKPTVSGTGFFISRDGYLLTNHHVIRGAAKIAVKVQDQQLPASLVSADAGNDFALLKVDGDFTPIPLGDVREVGLGDAVMTVGFPNIEVQGLSPKLTRGEISSLKGIQDDPRVFQVSVPLQPGNSGGALIDASGNAIGITTAQLDALTALKFSGSLPQNVNYALKISYARLLIDTVPHLLEKLPSSQKGKLEPSAITDRAIHGAALILVWQDADDREATAPTEK